MAPTRVLRVTIICLDLSIFRIRELFPNLSTSICPADVSLSCTAGEGNFSKSKNLGISISK
jgi:hypothetical protein